MLTPGESVREFGLNCTLKLLLFSSDCGCLELDCPQHVFSEKLYSHNRVVFKNGNSLFHSFIFWSPFRLSVIIAPLRIHIHLAHLVCVTTELWKSFNVLNLKVVKIIASVNTSCHFVVFFIFSFMLNNFLTIWPRSALVLSNVHNITRTHIFFFNHGEFILLLVVFISFRDGGILIISIEIVFENLDDLFN